MPDLVAFNDVVGYIEVVSFDRVTEADIQGSIVRIVELSHEHGCNRVFVDATGQSTMPSTLEILRVFSDFPLHIKVAIFFQKGQVTQSDLQFVETVSLNRDRMIRIFSTRQAAISWLVK
ncbi:MAG: hypothetical protein KDC35_17505 [Acidobacteria bacterium]|nr:hypothetical protein [Acidobacteriota bacterium]